MRQLALLLTGLAILAGINFTVWRYEAAMTSGEDGSEATSPPNAV